MSYEEFEEAFLEKTRLNLKLIRHIHLKCLCAIICDPFDDTITLERFCNCVNWFGPMYPVEKFLERIRDLLQKKWFHGFVNSNKAAQLLKTRWSSTKQQVCWFLAKQNNKKNCYVFIVYCSLFVFVLFLFLLNILSFQYQYSLTYNQFLFYSTICTASRSPLRVALLLRSSKRTEPLFTSASPTRSTRALFS